MPEDFFDLSYEDRRVKYPANCIEPTPVIAGVPKVGQEELINNIKQSAYDIKSITEKFRMLKEKQNKQQIQKWMNMIKKK